MPTQKILVVIAIKEESQGIFEKNDIHVLFTGLGKVNAAYQLTRALAEQKEPPALVVNFGTAGSPRFPSHELIECTQFVQRDMDLSALGVTPGETLYDSAPKTLTCPKLIPNMREGICGSGDSFETSQPRVHCDVVDMEAYALAKVCWFEKVPFLSIKYITDGSDQNAHKDWKANLPHAAHAFWQTYLELADLIVVSGREAPEF